MSSTSRKKAPVDKKTVEKKDSPITFKPIFGRQNYILLLSSFVVLVIGFILMYGPDDPVKKYDFQRLTLAPIVVMLGFALAGYSIFHKDKSAASHQE